MSRHPLVLVALLGCSFVNAPPGATSEDCGDGHDNDLDGRIDCADDECRGECEAVGTGGFGDERPVSLAPCPAGWTPTELWTLGRTVGPFMWCDPPDLAAGPCPGASDELFPGADPAAIHVVEGAEPGGDGTAAAPFRSLAEGLAAAEAGAELLVVGVHHEDLVSSTPIAVRGPCAAMAVIVGTVEVESGGGLALSDIGVIPPPGAGAGVVHAGGSLAMEGVVVRGGDARSSTGLLVRGHATLRDSVIQQTADHGLEADCVESAPSDPCVSADQVVIREIGVLEGEDSQIPGALRVRSGGVSATRLRVDSPRGYGAHVLDGRLELSDSILTGADCAGPLHGAVCPARRGGKAIRVEVGGTLLGDTLVVHQNSWGDLEVAGGAVLIRTHLSGDRFGGQTSATSTVVEPGGHLSMRDFRIYRSGQCGLRVEAPVRALPEGPLVLGSGVFQEIPQCLCPSPEVLGTESEDRFWTSTAYRDCARLLVPRE